MAILLSLSGKREGHNVVAEEILLSWKSISALHPFSNKKILVTPIEICIVSINRAKGTSGLIKEIERTGYSKNMER